jgi:hypothetical protein
MGFDRTEPPMLAGERETLRGFLDFQRDTLEMKCAGLTDAQLRTRAVPSSGLTLLGLMRHMAEVERQWFRRTIAGESVPHVWSATHDFQQAYDVTGATHAQALAAWREETAHARRIEERVGSLDEVRHVARWGEDVSVRGLLHHVLHEYARHNGHADLLREAVDGTVGV